MAYITAQEVKNIRQMLKDQFPEFKFSVSGGNSLKLHVAIMKGSEDFSDILGTWKSFEINQYNLEGYGRHSDLFQKIFSVMKSQSWFDKSDASTDYFNTAYYMSLRIGQWDKPYERVA